MVCLMSNSIDDCLQKIDGNKVMDGGYTRYLKLVSIKRKVDLVVQRLQ